MISYSVYPFCVFSIFREQTCTFGGAYTPHSHPIESPRGIPLGTRSSSLDYRLDVYTLHLLSSVSSSGSTYTTSY